MMLELPADSRRLRLLRAPIYRTRDRAKAQRSHFAYGIASDGVYTLSALGVLHGLIGLTIYVA